MAAKHILMLASENDALPGGKVGGIGDVIRDLPPALVEQGSRVTVLTPAYGHFAALPGATKRAGFQVAFAAGSESVTIYEVPGRHGQNGVRHLVVDHPLFALQDHGQAGGMIYYDDGPGAPFATDATRFALFCAAAASGLAAGVIERPDVIHLHDWHAALFVVLTRFDPRLRKLARIRSVFTIHNLSLQGVRPFDGHDSSLLAWFPNLQYQREALADPRWPDCVNLMACGIRFADRVHTVSRRYADEILRPNSETEQGFVGGEGLETDLQAARAGGRLQGILNGCTYPPPGGVSGRWPDLLALAREQLLIWAASHTQLASPHFIAQTRLQKLTRKRPGALLTSVGRLTNQKARLFMQITSDGESALDAILGPLGTRGLFILLGTGSTKIELFMTAAAARHRNFLFLQGYSEAMADVLYRQGDLFLMPSSFEPSGMSQMLAMRCGQPCVVHGVGGLQDTVTHRVSGFVFNGTSLRQQADRFAETTANAIEFKGNDPEGWRRIRRSAAGQRFRWSDTAAACLRELYQ